MSRLRFDKEDLRDETPGMKPKRPKRKPAPKPDTSIDTDGDGYINDDIANKADRADADGDGYTGDDEAHKHAPDDADRDGYSGDDAAAATDKPKSSGKLKFTAEEQKIGKLEQRADQYGEKLTTAREKLPSKVVKKKQRFYNEEKGRRETKFTFEKEPIPIGEAKWNKPKKKSIPQKAVGAAATAGVNKLHSKIYEVEHENVGTQAAHRAELVGESAYRGGKRLTHSAYRFVRNSPYRKVSKLETKSIKTDMKLSYQKALRDNPKLKSNPVSRFFQKRGIKKQYAAALKNAKNTAKTAKKTGSVISKASSAVTNIVRKNPVFLLKCGGLLLIVFAVMSLFTMCSTLFSGGTAFIGATSYAAEDTDIDRAELAYTEWETDLQLEIQNAESTHGGYDEYRYNVGDIGHDPFELMGFLTSVYEDFTYSEVESVLRGMFAEQYNLSFTPEVEIRTRTETRTDTWTDDEGNSHSDTYEVEVEYEWHILNVSLVSRSFSAVINPRMSADQREHFEILMMSKGNRQYVDNPFGFNWLPYVTSYYGYRVHPISGDKNYHKGVDIGLPTGTEIKAGFDGTVTTAGYDAGGYGNYIVVEMRTESGAVIQAKYAHCNTLLFSAGQTVKKGDVIATVGNTGNSTGPHLHIEVIKDGSYLNPIYFVITGDDGSGRIPPGSPGGVAFPDYSGEPMGDGSYAALVAEAERFLGYPYVWGGSSPSTSFDCSGYISYILRSSGVRDVGRQTAQGLYNLCTPVSMENLKPGDLLFFHSTYSSPNPVSHVALYLGGDRFIHCGDPIGYGSLSSNYWQQHFYAGGRIN